MTVLVLILKGVPNMANIMLGGGVTDIRGSIGGNTFSRSKSGNYIRARKKPVNPRSNLQESRRAAASMLSREWGKTLTEVQRAAWRAYADATNWTNSLGQTITIPGLSAFLRTGAMLVLAGESYQATAPTESGSAGAVDYTFTATEDDQKIVLTEPTAPWDKDTNDDFVLFFQGLTQPAGRIAVPGLFNFLGKLEGDDTTPPTFPHEFSSKFTFNEDNQITIASVHLDALGRVSGRTFKRVQADPT